MFDTVRSCFLPSVLPRSNQCAKTSFAKAARFRGLLPLVIVRFSPIRQASGRNCRVLSAKMFIVYHGPRAKSIVSLWQLTTSLMLLILPLFQILSQWKPFCKTNPCTRKLVRSASRHCNLCRSWRTPQQSWDCFVALAMASPMSTSLIPLSLLKKLVWSIQFHLFTWNCYTLP